MWRPRNSVAVAPEREELVVGFVAVGTLLVFFGIAYWKGKREHARLALGLILMSSSLWFFVAADPLWAMIPFVEGVMIFSYFGGLVLFSMSCPLVLRLPPGTKGTIIAGVSALAVTVAILSCAQRSRVQHWHAGETRKAIELGRTYAWSLLWGRKEHLLEMSVGLARQKVESSNTEHLPIYGVLNPIWEQWSVPEEKQLDTFTRYLYVLGPLVAREETEGGGEQEELELVVLEKLDGVLVMTFAYRHYGHARIVEIPGQGKMLFAVAMLYKQPEVAKAGRWVVCDYHYTYTLADYRNWVLRGGQEAADKIIDDVVPSVEEIMSLSNEVMREADLKCEWVRARIRGQIEEVEGLRRSLREAAKRSDD